MNCGIIFWGNSPHSIHVFRQQKGPLELSPGQDLETLAENYLKITDFTISIAIYIFTLSICSKQ